MKQTKLHLFALTTLLLLAFATSCGSIRPQETPPPASADEEAIDAPSVDMGMPVPPAEGELATPVPEMVVTDQTTHTDEAYGYTFDYPSAWMLDPVVLGSRAPGGYQITSWQHEPGMISDVLPDGTAMNIVLQLWDPKGDLAAFTAQRKYAWENSGIEIIFEEDVTLAGGKPAKEFVTKSQEQGSYTLFTTLGENYLVVSGTGDLEAIRGVAWSLR